MATGVGRVFVISAGIILAITIGTVNGGAVPGSKINTERIESNGILKTERDFWDDDGVSAQLKVYIYNITNPGGIASGEKLKFEQHGPYVYREERIKKTELNAGDETASYNRTKYYYFDQEASVGSVTDLFNVPNVPLIILAHKGFTYEEDSESFTTIKNVLALLNVVYGENLVKEGVSVSELLFEGWSLPVMYTQLPFPEFRDGRYGLYKGQNGTSDGQYLVHTDSRNYGKIISWEGKQELNWWFTPRQESDKAWCDKINGTDGSVFHPAISKESALQAFDTQLCRSVRYNFNSEVTTEENDLLLAYKFTLAANLLGNPFCNKNNKCFCPKQHAKLASQCWEGALRLFPCRDGNPLVASYPHFFHGGEELFEPIEITVPQADDHETFVEVDPVTGTVVRASKKIQLNVELQNFQGFELFQSLDFSPFTESPSILLPILWTEEVSEEKAVDSHGRE